MILRNLILRDGQKSPAVGVPVAMMLIVTGLMLTMIGVFWPRLSFPAAHLGQEWNDFPRGVMFGIAIVLEISGVVIAATAAAAASRAKKL